MLIRILTADDAALYREIRLRGLRENPTAFGASFEQEVEWSLDEFAERIASESRIGQPTFGAFENGKLVGVSSLGRPTADKLRHIGIVWGMYVIPELQGRGIGRSLLNEVISHARSVDGIQQIKLVVNTTNEAGKRLYRAAGFVPFGVEPRALFVDGTFYDEEHYILRIDQPEEGGVV